MTYTDSLQVEEQEDGTFSVSWDENDSKYSFLNDITQEEMNDYFTHAIQTYLKEMKNEPTQ
jgi:hypothetical protein